MTLRRGVKRRRPSAPSPSPAFWIGARARNALRRPVFIGTVSVVTFVAALVALVVVPQQARRTANSIRPNAAARPDTEPTVTSLAEAERQVAAADSGIATARDELHHLIATAAAAVAADTTATGDTLSRTLRMRRDSLTEDAALLAQLLDRSANAPLLGSYRALAEAPPMRSDPRVKQLLDSLVEIERERESYNAVGGVDPVFVALTARANELGHSIEALADARRKALEGELKVLAPAGPSAVTQIASRPLPDTMARIAKRDSARAVAALVAARLARERAELQRLDSLEERARELASVGASPPAMLAAALVFGAMLGFGVALFDEVRRPRAADPYEIERITGQRVLGVIQPLPPSPERGRREADRNGPRYLDPGADGHQLIYLTIATAGTSVVMLTITGDHPAVSAVVAINFAAIAAQEARATLLVDTDVADTVESALHLAPTPGVAGLVDGKVTWPEAIRTARVGRDRTIDIVSSGHEMPPMEQLTDLLRRDIGRLARRYDAIVVVSSPDQATQGVPAALPIKDVVFCARVGQTPLADLKKSIEELEQAGGRVRGIILWNAPDPVFEEMPAAPAPAREKVAV